MSRAGRASWWRRNYEALQNGVRRQGLRRYLGDRLILRFRIRPVKQIEGWLTPAEAAALYRMAAGMPARATVVEIGCWKGKSTYCLARGLPSGGRVIAIDPFDGAGEPGSDNVYEARQGDQPLLQQFNERMRHLGVSGQVEPWPGYSSAFVDRLEAIQALFIDGDHSPAGCEFDFTHFAPAIVPGGILAIHDYRPERGADWGPNWVIDQLVVPGGVYQPLAVVDSLWQGRKRSP